MNKREDAQARLVVMIPHDDAAAPINAYRSRLFSAGLRGALALPVCIVLGRADRPLRKDELKALAAGLRGSSPFEPFVLGAPGPLAEEEEPARTLGVSLLACVLYPGPRFEDAAGAFAPFEIPAMPIAAAPGAFPIDSIDSPFPLRFRAACVANLLLRRMRDGVPGLSYEWTRGSPVWLPKPKAARREAE